MKINIEELKASKDALASQSSRLLNDIIAMQSTILNLSTALTLAVKEKEILNNAIKSIEHLIIKEVKNDNNSF
jgi:hypothetical protein